MRLWDYGVFRPTQKTERVPTAQTLVVDIGPSVHGSEGET